MKRKVSRSVSGKAILWFDELSMKEAKRASKLGKVVIIPVGSVEEHGEHLPLCTDSIQPEYVALEVAKKTGCLVAPPLRYGVCVSTRNFPGTISISFESLYSIMRDILSEFIRNGFSKILVLSGHAGELHMAALRLAAQEVIQESTENKTAKKPRIIVCSDYDFAYKLKGKYFDERDGHGGTIETSRVMAMRPDLIKGKGKKSYPKIPPFEIFSNPEKHFPSGIIGDPTAASAKKGNLANDYVIKEIIKLVEQLKSED